MDGHQFQLGDVVMLKSQFTDGVRMTVLARYAAEDTAPVRYDLATQPRDGQTLITFQLPEFALKLWQPA